MPPNSTFAPNVAGVLEFKHAHSYESSGEEGSANVC